MLTRFLWVVALTSCVFLAFPSGGSLEQPPPLRSSIVGDAACTLNTSCYLYQTIVAFHRATLLLLGNAVPVLLDWAQHIEANLVSNLPSHVDHILNHAVPTRLHDLEHLRNDLVNRPIQP